MEEPCPEYLSCNADLAVYRPHGTQTFEQAVDSINRALEFCRSRNIRKLLVNILHVSGFPPPNTIQRFIFATKWAETAKGKVALAVVAPPEMIDSDKIGVTMAVNRGLATDVFTSEDEAVEWLAKR